MVSPLERSIQLTISPLLESLAAAMNASQVLLACDDGDALTLIAQSASDASPDLVELLELMRERTLVYGLSTLDPPWWAIPLEQRPYVVLIHAQAPVILEEEEFLTWTRALESVLDPKTSLSLSEELSVVLENAQDGFFALDPQWRFVYANQSAESILGRSRHELFGQDIWTLYPMMEGTTFAREYRAAIHTKKPRHFEAYATHLRAWFDISAYPNPRYLGVYFHDITIRKHQRMRERLLTELELLSQSCHSQEELLICLAKTICAHTGWSYAQLWTKNERTASYYGLDLSQEKPTPLVNPPELLNTIAHALQTQLPLSQRQGSPEVKEALYVKLGDALRITCVLAFLHTHNLDHEGWASLIVSLRQELTQLVNRRLKQLEFERLFNLSSDLMCVANPKGYFLQVNPAFIHTLGYSQEELTEKTFLEFVHPQDLQRTQDELRRLAHDNANKTHFENRYICADGRVRWLSWTSHTIVEEGVIYAVARDVTEDKQQLRMESLQRRVLEKIAAGEGHEQVMTLLAKLIEEQDPSLTASFQLLDANQSLILACAPSLPDPLAKALFPLEIGPDTTTIGCAAYHKHTIISVNVEHDPRWYAHQEVAKAHHVRACWATPLLASNDQLLGTMSVYCKKSGEPTAHQLSLLEHASRLATITIDRAQSQRLIDLLLRALDTCHDMVAVSTSDDDQIVYANRAMLALLHEEHIIKQKILGARVAIKPEHPQAQEPAHEIITLGDGHEHTRWLELSVSAIEARSHHFITIARDISARINVEELLSEREERFRLLADATNDTLYDWSCQDGALWWSEGLERTFGYSASQKPRTHLERVATIHPDERAAFERSLQEAFKAKQAHWTFEYRFIRADGTVAWVVDRGHCLYDAQGNPMRVIGGITDLTLRHEAEQRLQAQAELLDKTQDLIYVLDLEGHIQYWNKRAEKLYELPFEQAIGKPIYEITGASVESILTHIDVVLAQGYWNGEMHVMRQGRKMIFDSRWTLMRTSQGQAPALLIAQTDITERKQLEAQYLRAQRMESIGTLAGGIAHDLNNILTPILVSAGLLRDTFEEPDRIELIDDIELAANRGAELVKQILTFARGTETKHASIETHLLFKDILRITRESFPRNIQVYTKIAPEIPWLEGDATQLHQVLLNLAINARDAMPDGGHLTFSAEQIEVDEHYAAMHPGSTPGSYVLISVMDSGHGIAPDVQERIFEPFFTTKPYGQGTGLGLSTVQAIVKSHGGFMTLYSELEKGTTFKIYLPTSDQVPAQAKEQAQLLRGHGELILIIDDEASILSVTQQTLEAFGYRVIAANDGAEAIAIYAERRHEIALVLTDIMMPIMDGLVTARAMMRLNNNVKIIAASGLSANATLARLTDVGVRHFLPKPYTAESLLTKVRQVIQPD